MALTETWLSSEITDGEVLPDSNDYIIYRRDRDDRRGGGVLLAIKKHITSFLVPMSSSLKILWVCVSFPHSNALYGICYRPPDSSYNFISESHDNITSIRSKYNKADMFLLGDFNFPDIDWQNLRGQSRASCEFVQLTLDFSLVQLTDQPTRINNILDLLLSSVPERVNTITFADGFSDHRLLQFRVHTPSCSRHLKTKQVFDYKRANVSAINNGLESFMSSFLTTFSERTVNENWCLYKDKLIELAHAHIPKVSFRVNSSKPWFSKALRTLKNKKKRL